MRVCTREPKLHSLPYDIFYQVVEDLDLSDFNNLSRVNRSLYNLLQNDQLAKRTIKKYARYSKEAQWAIAGNISFRQAIGRIHDMQQAVAMAEPYSVAVLAYAATFIYRDGVLSYVIDNEIRVLNVHRADSTEQVVDVHNMLRRIIPAYRQHQVANRSVQISFLHYSSGVLAFLVEFEADRHAWLILLDVTPGCSRRLKFMTQLECTRRLFVRHNGTHLYYGVHSFVNASGELLWVIQWVDLTRNTSTRDVPPTILDKLAGTEIGHNVCFEIFDNHLYAVSNIIDSEEEALNWRSFYEWVCIPPARNLRRARMNRIWRRDHLEGPINDTWTEMSLRMDEKTGRPMILECRREWREGRSDHVRTYYAEPLPPFPELAATGEIQGEAEHTTPRITPQPPSSMTDSPFESGIAPSNITLPTPLPLNGPSAEDLARHKRIGKHVHSEYTCNCSTRKEFILAKTKYRTYNLSACAFVDLVNDPEPNNRVGAATDRLRLRINSRKRKYTSSGEDHDHQHVYKRSKLDDSTAQISSTTNEKEDVIADHVRLWPPDNADEELIRLLCPTRKATNIHAIADERSLIYSVDTDEPQKQAIILINFDPQFRLPCMHNRSQEFIGKQSSSESAPVGIGLIGPEDTKKSSRRQRCSILSPCSSSYSANSNNGKSSVRTEAAMHLSIDKGYWFDIKRW
ncbi:F-box domain protein [Talaromyces stipitatus ATCC 10500]|uniref:F-box domain protein n=1 Tax=Talaromyces stipitatus (strain ATCC 10500 / CBS 375.48 / QM 6759 / NRRL 1006) TaxID=441959 RepID=B8M574_TALSN|nr:F-box domain protein [Talaromyces stipitatus ATCC 10500]EED19680.1 F-box domain protein [Talaromyces stipitatus ATCC 10500]